MTEATFPGYAAVTSATWNSPYIDITGRARVDLADATFVASGAPTSSQSVVGWYLTDAGNATLWLAGQFVNPVPITQQYDGVTVSGTYGYGD